MYEKILQKLKTQREKTSNVSDRSLEDLARTLSSVITTEEQVTAADFSPAIKSIDGNINRYTAQAIKLAKEKEVADAEAKRNADVEAKKGNPPSDDTPAWAKALMEQNQKLEERLAGFEKSKATTSRQEKLNALLKDMPEFHTKPILAAFGRTNFEKDEDFDSYLEEIKTSNETFIQSAKEHGLNSFIPVRDIKKPVEDGQTGILADARALVTKQKEELAKK